MHPLDLNLNTKLITGSQKIATKSAEVYYKLQHLYVLGMDQYIYRLVSHPSLNLYNLFIDVSYSLEVLTLSTALPVSDVELS